MTPYFERVKLKLAEYIKLNDMNNHNKNYKVQRYLRVFGIPLLVLVLAIGGYFFYNNDQDVQQVRGSQNDIWQGIFCPNCDLENADDDDFIYSPNFYSFEDCEDWVISRKDSEDDEYICKLNCRPSDIEDEACEEVVRSWKLIPQSVTFEEYSDRSELHRSDTGRSDKISDGFAMVSDTYSRLETNVNLDPYRGCVLLHGEDSYLSKLEDQSNEYLINLGIVMDVLYKNRMLVKYNEVEKEAEGNNEFETVYIATCSCDDYYEIKDIIKDEGLRFSSQLWNVHDYSYQSDDFSLEPMYRCMGGQFFP